MSSFVLKLIAIISMFIDHFGAEFDMVYNTENFRAIGRIAFPIFAFLIAEGCKHTRDIKKYAMRLGIFALISEIPFDYCFMGAYRQKLVFLERSHQNVYFTFFVAVSAIYIAKECGIIKKEHGKNTSFTTKLLGYVSVIAIFIIGDALKFDYGTIGIISIYLCYIVEKRWLQIAVLFVMVTALYLPLFNPIDLQSYFYYKVMICCVISLVSIGFYNNQRGYDMRWFFYAFYPGHLIVIAIVYNLYCMFVA